MNQIKPVLDLSKKHVFELSLAGAVVVGLFATWWFIPPKTQEMVDEANKRWQVKQQLDSTAGSTPDVAGVVYVKDGNVEKDFKGLAVTEALTKKKQEASDKMLEAKKKMDAAASELNLRGRVKLDRDGNVLAALFDEVELERTDKLQRNEQYLPVKNNTRADANIFVDRHYNKIFDRFALRLNGARNANDGVVPLAKDLENLFKEKEAEKAAAVDPLLKGKAGPGGAFAGGGPQMNMKERDDFFRNAVMDVANRSEMYVDPRWSFQKRDLGARGTQPTAHEIFEAYVDCWLQKDVVEAIRAVNDTAKNKPGNKTEGVTRSPIKRLVWVAVGPAALSTFSGNTPSAAAAPAGASGGTGGERPREKPGLFLRAPVQVLAGGAAPPKSPAEQTFSLTGRLGDETFHVVPMSVTIVCEPSAVVSFIDALYKRNNGYTVLNRRDSTVDPYASAGAGYLYGSGPAVQVDLLVECLLFRSWVDQIRPEGYGSSAGSGPGAPAGIPGGMPGGPPGREPENLDPANY